MVKREQEKGEASCRSCAECRGQEVGEDRKCGEGLLWRVWRYQRVNQNPYIEEEQTIIVI
jgi:hypothetical protein